MTAAKRKATAEKPPPHTDETGSNDRGRRRSGRGRPHPPEPFEECGPKGGYGGAGTDEEAKEDD